MSHLGYTSNLLDRTDLAQARNPVATCKEYKQNVSASDVGEWEKELLEDAKVT